ncbi:hypothetical protein ABE485_04455 [Achromobacter spanius]|uniref:hypothetical protein n=1 Tax=Achromobacter spanius TaxID=217203 RepID=UPI0032082C1B
MNKNEEPLDSTQMANLPVEGGSGVTKKSTGETFSFYLTVITQCVDLVLKLSPVFMLGAGVMLWSYLREIGWTHLLLPTASSPSGLAFLAISALAFVGAAILIFLTPSLFFSSGLDFYEGRLTPARVKWILVGMAALWTIIFAAVGLIDAFSEKFSAGWALVCLYFAGLVGYALPGYSAACDACEKQSADNQKNKRREDDVERLWRAKFFEFWLMPGSEDADLERPTGETPLGQEDAGGDRQKTARKVPAAFAWLRPFLVVFMALAVVVTTSWPVLVLIRLWGEQLESSIGYIPAFFIILLCGGLAILPAFTYLHTRSQNVSSVVAAKRASVAAGGLVLLSLFSMIYAPIRDKVFHLLEIQSSREEYFLVSSPTAIQGLGMLGFPLAAMPLSVSDWSKKLSTVRPETDSSSKTDEGAKSKMPAEQNLMNAPAVAAKLDAPMIVQAWVGYSFGDTILLCRWRAGERPEKRDVPVPHGHSGSNVCLPLARSELRRLANVSADKSPAVPNSP